MLVGVTLSDGKSYCYKAKPISGFIIILFGILTIPFFGLGLIYIWHGFGELSNHSMCKELVQQGATQISISLNQSKGKNVKSIYSFVIFLVAI